MPEANILPPNFLALDREADVAIHVQGVIAHNPGAVVRYQDEHLVDELTETLNDWASELSEPSEE